MTDGLRLGDGYSGADGDPSHRGRGQGENSNVDVWLRVATTGK